MIAFEQTTPIGLTPLSSLSSKPILSISPYLTTTTFLLYIYSLQTSIATCPSKLYWDQAAFLSLNHLPFFSVEWVVCLHNSVFPSGSLISVSDLSCTYIGIIKQDIKYIGKLNLVFWMSWFTHTLLGRSFGKQKTFYLKIPIKGVKPSI